MDILSIRAAGDVVDFKRRVSIRRRTVPVEIRRGMLEPRHRAVLQGKRIATTAARLMLKKLLIGSTDARSKAEAAKPAQFR